MKKIILVILSIILFYGVALGATLTGRIIKEDGKPLANTNIQIEGNK